MRRAPFLQGSATGRVRPPAESLGRAETVGLLHGSTLPHRGGDYVDTGRGTYASYSGHRPFMFATGIENSYPTIALPDGRTKRVDEMAKCGHYDCWKRDFELVCELGIDYLRYGPPYYAVHTAPGVYDWSFADATFDRLRQLKITPIADLCHF